MCIIVCFIEVSGCPCVVGAWTSWVWCFAVHAALGGLVVALAGSGCLWLAGWLAG